MAYDEEMKSNQNDQKLSLIINLFIQYLHQVSKYSDFKLKHTTCTYKLQ